MWKPGGGPTIGEEIVLDGVLGAGAGDVATGAEDSLSSSISSSRSADGSKGTLDGIKDGSFSFFQSLYILFSQVTWRLWMILFVEIFNKRWVSLE